MDKTESSDIKMMSYSTFTCGLFDHIDVLEFHIDYTELMSAYNSLDINGVCKSMLVCCDAIWIVNGYFNMYNKTISYYALGQKKAFPCKGDCF